MEAPTSLPTCTLEDFETTYAQRHLLHGVVAHWAYTKPQDIAIINFETKESITWQRFDLVTTAMAMRLLEMGISKGDFVATSLPMLTEHIFLQYACFKIGAIAVPLDLRLKAPEVIRSLSLVKPKLFAFLGKTAQADFRLLGKAVMEACPYIEHFIQYSPPQLVIDGATSAFTFGQEALELAQQAMAAPEATPQLSQLFHAMSQVDEHDGALVVFTTGSTGYPKPALLSHRNITCQNMCLGRAFGLDESSRMLVNLPASHVGGQTEQLMTPLFMGGSVVTLHVFDPAASLQAIQDYNITCYGQIPALFNLQWRLSTFDSYDLSSIKVALYAGQSVPRPFIERVAGITPYIGTGLGLTECAGFCTYTKPHATVDELTAGIGYAMPAYQLTIREPMAEDGSAGEELATGTVGHICFKGPQTFLGYVGDPEATAKTISSDGWLYTGDMGSYDDMGLHLSGRARHVIKPKGFQVFPAQIEEHFCALKEKVASCGVVGCNHAVYSEGVVAFIEKKPGVSLSTDELQEHAKELASYMRPQMYYIFEPGQLPLNRVAKTDYLELQNLASEEVEKLRAKGGWDS